MDPYPYRHLHPAHPHPPVHFPVSPVFCPSRRLLSRLEDGGGGYTHTRRPRCPRSRRRGDYSGPPLARYSADVGGEGRLRLARAGWRGLGAASSSFCAVRWPRKKEENVGGIQWPVDFMRHRPCHADVSAAGSNGKQTLFHCPAFVSPPPPPPPPPPPSPHLAMPYSLRPRPAPLAELPLDSFLPERPSASPTPTGSTGPQRHQSASSPVASSSKHPSPMHPHRRGIEPGDGMKSPVKKRTRTVTPRVKQVLDRDDLGVGKSPARRLFATSVAQSSSHPSL